MATEGTGTTAADSASGASTVPAHARLTSAEPRITHTPRPFSASRFDDEDFFGDSELTSILAQLAEDTRASAPARACLDSTCVPGPDRRTLSLEVFPARSPDKLRANVTAVRRMLALGTDFVTVTYGAAGSRQEGTKEIVTWLAEAGVPTFAHLTCQADSLAELDATIDELLSLGVVGILALRGDARADGKGLVLPHATDLIARVRARAEAAGRPVRIAVAAFPTGHPESASLEEDAATVARKQDAGADFAITQHFFYAEDYVNFTAQAAAHGSTLPIVPGLTPITSPARLKRMCELAATEMPPGLYERLEAASPDTRRDIAAETTVGLARALASAGAPGIQLFTMNDEPTATRIFTEIGPLFGKTTPAT